MLNDSDRIDPEINEISKLVASEIPRYIGVTGDALVSQIRKALVLYKKAEHDRSSPWLLTLRYYINNPSAWGRFDQSMSDNIESCLRGIDPSILEETSAK